MEKEKKDQENKNQENKRINGDGERESIFLADRERLTDKEQVMLDWISTHVREYGYPPTIRELCEMTGYSSPATTMARVRSLEKKGYLARKTLSPRAITLL